MRLLFYTLGGAALAIGGALYFEVPERLECRRILADIESGATAKPGLNSRATVCALKYQ